MKYLPEIGDLDAKLANFRLPEISKEDSVVVGNKTVGSFRKNRVGTAPEGLGTNKGVNKRAILREKRLDKRMSETNYHNNFDGLKIGKNNAGNEDSGVKQQNFLQKLGVEEKHIPEGLKSGEPMQERGYDKMMDQHALHVFMIRNGKIIQETPEFMSFKRVIGRDLNRIVPFLLTIEQF